MELPVRLGTEKLALRKNAFASGKVYAAVGATHHLLGAVFRLRRVGRRGTASGAAENQVNNPDSQNNQ